MIDLWLKRSEVTKDGHWLFRGAHNSAGYGMVRFNLKLIPIHRVSAHLYLGLDLNSTLCALHKQSCPHKDCWNPDCLYVGTKGDNNKDIKALGHHVSGFRKRIR